MRLDRTRTVAPATSPSIGADERDLLLTCGRLTLHPEQVRRAEDLLRRPLSWAAIVFYARFHSTAPMLYRALDRIGAWSSVPNEKRLELLRLVHRTEYQNRIFARENAFILDAFHTAGVPAIIQKGIALVERVYGGLAIRPLIDLVFLVPRDRAAESTQALRRSGYTQRTTAAVEMSYRWCCPQLFFEASREINVAVLVQSDLVNWPRMHALRMPPLFDRARTVDITGRPALLLSPVDQLLYLCLQADNHGTFNRVGRRTMTAADLLFTLWTNNRQIRFVDIYETARHYGRELDWSLLAQRAREAGIEQPVLTSLSLTNDLIGTVADQGVLETLRDGRTHWLRRRMFVALSTREAQPTGMRDWVRSRWLSYSPGQQIQLGRLVDLAEFCFPDTDRIRVKYGVRSPMIVRLVFVLHAVHGVSRAICAYVGRRLRTVIEGISGHLVRQRPVIEGQRAQG